MSGEFDRFAGSLCTSGARIASRVSWHKATLDCLIIAR